MLLCSILIIFFYTLLILLFTSMYYGNKSLSNDSIITLCACNSQMCMNINYVVVKDKRYLIIILCTVYNVIKTQIYIYKKYNYFIS